jgi:diaphanous 1
VWLSLQIGAVPRLKARLEAMLFRRRFEHLLAEVMPDLGIMRSAALQLRDSERFKEVLQVSPLSACPINSSSSSTAGD